MPIAPPNPSHHRASPTDRPPKPRAAGTGESDTVTVIFSGTAMVAYSQMYLMSDPLIAVPELFAAFDGQANWWCGVGVPGTVFFRCGRQDGLVVVTVDIHATAPTLQPEPWDEIVEVSYRPVGDQVTLQEWGGDLVVAFDLPEDVYRIRWHGRGMDAATASEDVNPDVGVDRYLIQFWPADDVGELILKSPST